jgi:hypothetical protein
MKCKAKTRVKGKKGEHSYKCGQEALPGEELCVYHKKVIAGIMEPTTSKFEEKKVTVR